MNGSVTAKAWMFLGGIGVVLILLVGWLMFVSPARDDTAQAQAQAATARTQDEALQARLTQLGHENKSLPSYQRALASAQAALPNGDGMANFLRELQNLGNSTLVKVTNLAVSAPVVAGAAGQTPQAQPVNGVAPSASASSSAAPAPSAYAIPITLSATGSVEHLNAFLNQLQQVQPRAVLITQSSLGIGNNAAAGTVETTLTLTMDAFVAPDTTLLAPTASSSPSR